MDKKKEACSKAGIPNGSEHNAPSTLPLGLIAGGGALPVHIQNRCIKKGVPLVVAAVRDHSDSRLDRHTTHWFDGTKLMAMLKMFRRHRVQRLVLAGHFSRPNLWSFLWHNRYHLAFFWYYLQHYRLGDNNLLIKLRGFIEAAGFTIVGVNDVLTDDVAQAGLLSGKALDADETKAVNRGLSLLAELGRYDVGQALVVDGFRILAVEGAEGTDAMLERVAALSKPGLNGFGSGRSGFLLKAAKPQQSLQDDMPVVGVQTIENIAKTALKGLVLVDGQVLLADIMATIKAAEHYGLSIVVVKPV